MRKIYLAAPFSWQSKVLEFSQQLISLGYEITSEWLHQTTATPTPGLHADCQKLSNRDIRDIFASDTLILFEPGTAIERNTRVAEFGIALGTGRQCIVIAPEDDDKKNIISSIFVKFKEVPPELQDMNLKGVIEFSSWKLFIEDITTPQVINCCLGCGKSNCYGCPSGSFLTYRSASGLSVLPS